MTFVLLGVVACRTAIPVAPPPPGPIVEPGAGLQVDLPRVRAFHATRPEYERPLGEGLEPVPSLGSLSAEACGACHIEIAAEWKLSTHAVAWIDPQFQAEITKSGNRWLCLNCHTPLLVQQDLWPVGLQSDDVELPVLVPSPVFDAALRDEGITCAACHVRDGVIVGPGLGGESPHPVRVDPTLRTEAVCTRCHQAVAVYPGKSFVCTFQTGAEFAASPAAQDGQTCSTCHMPRVERPAAVGGPVRSVARHWWRGAGIPKFAGRQPPIEANPPGLQLEVEPRDGTLVLALGNAAGHLLPSGDPERWVQVDVRFFDATGATVGTAWSHRIGQLWEWDPAPRKLSDNRLVPGDVRRIEVPVPAGAVRAEVVAASHRMSSENAAYHDLGDYPLSVETHRLEVELPQG